LAARAWIWVGAVRLCLRHVRKGVGGVRKALVRGVAQRGGGKVFGAGWWELDGGVGAGMLGWGVRIEWG